MRKTKLLLIVALLLIAVSGAMAQSYTITLPSVSNGSVSAKVNDASVTSAAAGATVTLEATPDAGYKLKTISGVYSGTASETFSSGANTRTGTNFSVSGSNYTYGWRVGNGYTLTISSLSNQNLSQVVLTVGTAPNVSQRNISHLQADHGTLSATGTTQGNTITITGINSPTVTVSAPSSGNAASMWSITQAKIDGLGSVALTLTDTGDDNVKTFTMPSSNVTVSAAFEVAPINVTANLADGAYWATFYNENYRFQSDANTQVFKVELSGTGLTMHEVEDKIVNAYLPVVLKNSTDGNIVMTPTDAATSNTEPNSLNGWAGPAGLPADGNMYVLSYTAANGVGFYKLKDGSALGGGKAFLYYTGGGGAPAREFFGFDEITGIDATLVNSEKVDGVVYDLQGSRVVNPTKGLYIVNGKKVIIK